MAYLLFMLANAALFVRPAELFPALGNVQIYLALIGSAVLCNLQGLQNQLRPRTLIQQPVNLCVLGMVVAIPLSLILSLMYLGRAYSSGMEMAKIAVYYLMLVSVINTPQRLRQFLLVTGVCATVLVVASILDFQQFCATWEGTDAVFVQMEKDKEVDFDKRVLKHAIDVHGTDLLGNPKLVFRMRGLGIFNDPNDVALLIGVAMVICAYFLTDPRWAEARFVWLVPLAILGYGFIQTESRGGLLAIGAAGMVWLAVRYGGTVAIVIGMLGMLAAPVALGRAADMNVSDGSGQERIQIWAEGLAALKSPAILFGIGEGQYEEVAYHVAHNSYIHAFVELGLVGGSLFFGCFFLPVYGLYLIVRRGVPMVDPELRRMLPYIAAILTTWIVGMATLSRCYTPSSYMIVGLGAAYLNLCGFHQLRPRPIVVFNQPTAVRWAACSVGLLAASFAFVKVFARFSGA